VCVTPEPSMKRRMSVNAACAAIALHRLQRDEDDDAALVALGVASVAAKSPLRVALT
jgi:hypothetical protein